MTASELSAKISELTYELNEFIEDGRMTTVDLRASIYELDSILKPIVEKISKFDRRA